MRTLGGQRGFSLIEVVVVLAISAVLIVPLGSVAVGQFVVPARIAEDISATHRKAQISTSLSQDSLAAQAFTLGGDPVYGTFSWSEFGRDSPVPVTARYLWDDGAVLRIETRGVQSSPSLVVIDAVDVYSDVEFRFDPPAWSYDPVAKEWSYTKGTMRVKITMTRQAGARLTELAFETNQLTAFRSQLERPVPLPPMPPQ